MIRLAAIACILAAPVYGQSTCADRDGMTTALAATYGEQQRMVAVNGSSVIEFWGNEDASTWTLIVTYPDGVSCVLGAGIGFAVADEGPVGEKM